MQVEIPRCFLFSGSSVPMGRAFSPRVCGVGHTWGVAPGWDNTGRWPLVPRSNQLEVATDVRLAKTELPLGLRAKSASHPGLGQCRVPGWDDAGRWPLAPRSNQLEVATDVRPAKTQLPPDLRAKGASHPSLGQRPRSSASNRQGLKARSKPEHLGHHFTGVGKMVVCGLTILLTATTWSDLARARCNPIANRRPT